VTLSTVALDYDGTVAIGDVIAAPVRHAIAEARRHGFVIALVTGRLLSELRRVAGELHFVDVVVAENGAVVYHPGNERTFTTAPDIPQPFVDELRRRAIPFTAGQCLIDADAGEAMRILEVIRAMELALVLIFNRSRVMVTAQGVSKATGLHRALTLLRLSPRNMLALGDAENDFEMLRLAEVGVAVGWGSHALQAAADAVLPGTGPDALVAYLRDLATTGRLPPVSRGRRRLLLGHLDDGRSFSLAVRGRNVLITGDTKSGKSWIAGLLCEQLIEHGYSVCVIDLEGDYRPLEGLPGVSILGGDDEPPRPRDLLRALRYPDRSVVIDLSRYSHDDKLRHVRAILPALNVLRRRTGLPHRILLDEAHYYLHEDDAPQLLDLDRNGYTVVTFCASRLPREFLAATDVGIVTCESNPTESAALRARCHGCAGMADEQWARLGRLKTGQAAALPMTEEAAGQLQVFSVANRMTPHVRHREKYVDVPVSPDRAFVFENRGAVAVRARTLRQFVTALERTPPRGLQPFLARADFSRWVNDVFGDVVLAGELRTIETRHRDTPAPELATELAAAVRGRYDLTEDDSLSGSQGGSLASVTPFEAGGWR
jgi:hydroxymethylpyrimidine pyrophosphatase-like HAD family hydrolase